MEQQIAQVRKNIKRKYDELRRCRENVEEEQKIKYSPILQPLRRFVSKNQAHRTRRKRMEKVEEEEEEEVPWKQEDLDEEEEDSIEEEELSEEEEIKIEGKKKQKRSSIFDNVPNMLKLFTNSQQPSSGEPSPGGTSKIKITKRKNRKEPYVKSPTRLGDDMGTRQTGQQGPPEANEENVEEEPSAGDEEILEEGAVGGVAEVKDEEEAGAAAAGGEKVEEDRGAAIGCEGNLHGGIFRDYIAKRVRNDPQCDDIYGVRYDGRRFSIGDSILTFEDDTIKIGKNMVLYGTRGLLELMFMKEPNRDLIRDHDKQMFQQIIKKVHLHKKKYSMNESGNSDPKNPKWKILVECLAIKNQPPPKSATQSPKSGSRESRGSSGGGGGRGSRPGSASL